VLAGRLTSSVFNPNGQVAEAELNQPTKTITVVSKGQPADPVNGLNGNPHVQRQWHGGVAYRRRHDRGG